MIAKNRSNSIMKPRRWDGCEPQTQNRSGANEHAKENVLGCFCVLLLWCYVIVWGYFIWNSALVESLIALKPFPMAYRVRAYVHIRAVHARAYASTLFCVHSKQTRPQPCWGVGRESWIIVIASTKAVYIQPNANLFLWRLTDNLIQWLPVSG